MQALDFQVEIGTGGEHGYEVVTQGPRGWRPPAVIRLSQHSAIEIQSAGPPPTVFITPASLRVGNLVHSNHRTQQPLHLDGPAGTVAALYGQSVIVRLDSPSGIHYP